jgi:hypothetical protein
MRPLASPNPDTWLFMKGTKRFTLSIRSLKPQSGNTSAVIVPQGLFLKRNLLGFFLMSKLNFSIDTASSGSSETAMHHSVSVHKAGGWQCLNC